MATKRIAVVGDRTTTGGTIITGQPYFIGDGRPVACMGDKATCPKCGKVGTIIEGLPSFIIHGKPAALDGHIIACGCPARSNRIIAANSRLFADDTRGSSRASSSAPHSFSAEEPQADTASPSSPMANSLNSSETSGVIPVFAKSCLRGSGCTDAGSDTESVSNFGKVGFYQIAAGAAVAKVGAAATESLGTTAFRTVGGAATRMISGRWMTPSPWTVGLFGTFYSEKLNSDEQDFIDNSRLAEIATQRGTATTRLRFQWVTNGITGKPEVKGYHTGNGSISDQVPVRSMTKNLGTGGYEFWEDEAKGPSLLWTPGSPDFKLPKDTGNSEVFVPPPTILIIPEPTETGGYTETLPMPDEKNFRDYILVHPEGAFEPIYIYLSKPPVELLEVDLYGNFDGRSREGRYHADHMPSSAAVEAYLIRLNPETSPRQISEAVSNVASIIIPKEIHQRISETFGGRNQPYVIDRDSRDLRAALDRNLDAIKSALLEHGITKQQIESARAKMHKLNSEQGLYK